MRLKTVAPAEGDFGRNRSYYDEVTKMERVRYPDVRLRVCYWNDESLQGTTPCGFQEKSSKGAIKVVLRLQEP